MLNSGFRWLFKFLLLSNVAGLGGYLAWYSRHEYTLVRPYQLVGPRYSTPNSPTWNVELTNARSLISPSPKVWNIHLNSDGSKLVVAGGFGPTVWDLRAGAKTASLEFPLMKVQYGRVVPDNKNAENSATTFTLEDVEEWRHLGDNNTYIGYGSALSADGERLVTGGPDGNLRLWNIDDRKVEQEWEDRSGFYYSSMSLLPDEKTLLFPEGGPNSICARDILTGGVRRFLLPGTDSSPRRGFQQLAVSPDGSRLAGTVATPASPLGADIGIPGAAEIVVGDVREERVMQLLPQSELATGLAFSQDASTLAVGNLKGIVELWEMGAPAAHSTLGPVAGDQLYFVSFSPNGRLLATLSGVTANKTKRELRVSLQFWDVETGTEQARLSGTGLDTHIAISADWSTVVWYYDDNFFHPGPHRSLAFGNILQNESWVFVWDLKVTPAKSTHL